jgi:hypothetical protein
MSLLSCLRASFPIVLSLLYPCSGVATDKARLMDVLVASYPDFLQGHEGNVIIWKDGTRMPFDDGKSGKSFDELLNTPSLKDMFYAQYPLAFPARGPASDIDPGRVRNEAFFIKMYGDCRNGEVAKSLVDVVWLPKKWGKSIRVTRINGVAKQLKAISAKLDELPSGFDKYLFPPAGTLNCRTIAGTSRLSAHGTGSAIDIATKHSSYWRWAHVGAWRNEIPPEIVRVFEKHGFIWGGKWSHYDTMHFEYRPEIIKAGNLQ